MSTQRSPWILARLIQLLQQMEQKNSANISLIDTNNNQKLLFVILLWKFSITSAYPDLLLTYLYSLAMPLLAIFISLSIACLFDGVWHHFQQYFSYIVALSFIGGENRNTRRNLLTCQWQTLSHNVVLNRVRTHNFSGDRHCLIQLPYNHDHDSPYDDRITYL